MKRATISMTDKTYNKLSVYAENNGISFSRACADLASIGERFHDEEDLAESIIEHLIVNNIRFYMIGNFDLPVSVLKRALVHSISKSTEESPLVEFAEIIRA